MLKKYTHILLIFLCSLASQAQARFAAPPEVETHIMPVKDAQQINAYIAQTPPAFYETPLFISIAVFTVLVLALVLIIKRRNKTDGK